MYIVQTKNLSHKNYKAPHFTEQDLNSQVVINLRYITALGQHKELSNTNDCQKDCSAIAFSKAVTFPWETLLFGLWTYIDQ